LITIFKVRIRKLGEEQYPKLLKDLLDIAAVATTATTALNNLFIYTPIRVSNGRYNTSLEVLHKYVNEDEIIAIAINQTVKRNMSYIEFTISNQTEHGTFCEMISDDVSKIAPIGWIVNYNNTFLCESNQFSNKSKHSSEKSILIMIGTLQCTNFIDRQSVSSQCNKYETGELNSSMLRTILSERPSKEICIKWAKSDLLNFNTWMRDCSYRYTLESIDVQYLIKHLILSARHVTRLMEWTSPVNDMNTLTSNNQLSVQNSLSFKENVLHAGVGKPCVQLCDTVVKQDQTFRNECTNYNFIKFNHFRSSAEKLKDCFNLLINVAFNIPLIVMPILIFLNVCLLFNIPATAANNNLANYNYKSVNNIWLTPILIAMKVQPAHLEFNGSNIINMMEMSNCSVKALNLQNSKIMNSLYITDDGSTEENKTNNNLFTLETFVNEITTTNAAAITKIAHGMFSPPGVLFNDTSGNAIIKVTNGKACKSRSKENYTIANLSMVSLNIFIFNSSQKKTWKYCNTTSGDGATTTVKTNRALYQEIGMRVIIIIVAQKAAISADKANEKGIFCLLKVANLRGNTCHGGATIDHEVLMLGSYGGVKLEEIRVIMKGNLYCNHVDTFSVIDVYSDDIVDGEDQNISRRKYGMQDLKVSKCNNNISNTVKSP